MFIDESGTHELGKIDPSFPVFVLAGVIVDMDYYPDVQKKVDEYKLRLFGRTDITLHTLDITRNRKGFEAMADPAFRQRFYEETNELLRSLDFKVVACAIRKQAHIDRYGDFALDPYHFSLRVLVERFCMEVGGVAGGGVIWAEKRRPDLDAQLERVWQELRLTGTGFISGGSIRNRLVPPLWGTDEARRVCSA